MRSGTLRSLATRALIPAFALLLFLACPCAATPPLALNDAIRMALDHNATLARGALAIERQRLGVESARSEFDLRLSPAGSVNNSDGDLDWHYGLRAEKKFLWGTEIGLGPVVDRYPAFVDDNWRSAFKVDVRQPLFRDFGTLVAGEGLTAAGERLTAERRRWELLKADTVVEVVRSFESIIRLRKQIDCDHMILDRTDRLRELTRIRERQGRSSRVDTLRIELLLGQAQSRLETHREELFSATRELTELLGLPADKDPDLAATPLPDLELPSIEQAVGTALSNRLDFAQAIDDGRRLKRQALLARRKLEPALFLMAENRQYDQGERFADSLDLNRNLWTVGLGGSMDLINSRERADVASAKLDVEDAWAATRIKARTVTREVQQAVSAYRQARTELAMAGRNVDSSQARSELARRLFEMGRGDTFAAADAENAFIEAEANLLATRARTCVAGFNLLRLLGTLADVHPSLKPRLTELPHD